MNGGVMPKIRVNGADLFYVDQGVGVPVVFVHGAWMDLRYWGPQREEVAAHDRFVVYTLRYHGTVPWPEPFRQMVLDNARTVPLAVFTRPPAFSCAMLTDVKAPALVVAGEQSPPSRIPIK
jgi:hypothetical protein